MVESSTLPKPTQLPRYPHLPPTKSVVDHPHLWHSHPHRIREAFAKPSNRFSWELQVQPWQPRRSIEQHNEEVIRHVNQEWRVVRQPPKLIERTLLLRKLKIISVFKMFSRYFKNIKILSVHIGTIC